MALPKPIWTDHDIDAVRNIARDPSSLIWNTWNDDPTKIAAIRAIVSCQVILGDNRFFFWDMASALAQKAVCSLHSYSLEVEAVHY